MSAEPPVPAAGPNGIAHPSPGDPPGSNGSRIDRADRIVTNFSESVSSIASRSTRGVGRLFSWVKDEMRSMWDEAQSIRRGDQPPPPCNQSPEAGASKEQPR